MLGGFSWDMYPDKKNHAQTNTTFKKKKITKIQSFSNNMPSEGSSHSRFDAGASNLPTQ